MTAPNEHEIEAAAQAIRSTVTATMPRAKDWSELRPLLRDRYRDEATAAITAYLRAKAANQGASE